MLNRQRLVVLSLMNTSSTVFKVTFFTSRCAFRGCCRKHIRICFFIRIFIRKRGLYLARPSSRDLQQPHRNTTFLYLLETSYFHRWSSKQNLCDYLISCGKLALWKLRYSPLSWGAVACCSVSLLLITALHWWNHGAVTNGGAFLVQFSTLP